MGIEKDVRGAQASPRRGVGLCAGCRFASVKESARGSAFWRCERADADPAFPRYPSLPVTHCAGFASKD
ncbi:MAG: hypothetical protein VCC02_11200 [Myxococcota bacterium]|jgi:hypothetical protein